VAEIKEIGIPGISSIREGRQAFIRADVLAAYLMGFSHCMLLWLAFMRV
jgi:hypothetical protein